jgi:hypothetical protein
MTIIAVTTTRNELAKRPTKRSKRLAIGLKITANRNATASGINISLAK